MQISKKKKGGKKTRKKQKPTTKSNKNERNQTKKKKRKCNPEKVRSRQKQLFPRHTRRPEFPKIRHSIFISSAYYPQENICFCWPTIQPLIK